MQTAKIKVINYLKNPKFLGSLIAVFWFAVGTYAFTWPPVGCTPGSCSSPLGLDYINQRVGIGTNSPEGNLDLNDWNVKNVDWSTSDSPFAWAGLQLLTTGTYYASDGTTDAGMTLPGVGLTECTSGGNACIYNQGNYLEIGIKVPDDATNLNWWGYTDTFCWPVPLGDQEPLQNDWDSGIDVYGKDSGGQGMAHCVTGAPSTDVPNQIMCIKTAGNDMWSATYYGIACMK